MTNWTKRRCPDDGSMNEPASAPSASVSKTTVKVDAASTALATHCVVSLTPTLIGEMYRLSPCACAVAAAFGPWRARHGPMAPHTRVSLDVNTLMWAPKPQPGASLIGPSSSRSLARRSARRNESVNIWVVNESPQIIVPPVLSTHARISKRPIWSSDIVTASSATRASESRASRPLKNSVAFSCSGAAPSSRSRWERIISPLSTATMAPGPRVHGPPVKSITLPPRAGPPASSMRETASSSAAPVARRARWRGGGVKGSTCRPSMTEVMVNSASSSGTRKRPETGPVFTPCCCCCCCGCCCCVGVPAARADAGRPRNWRSSCLL
mmetsp:Transcript_27730/g.85939  ORF Transcript_27730/g.85939 Transcript_27730/m.85939 type:complete len:325 (-) Transcript_27730:1029-2003(-)